MRKLPGDASAAERARWLAEVADALARAQVLAWQLGADGALPDALELYAQIELAAAEVRSLRLVRPQPRGGQDYPEWGKDLPWASG